MKILTQSTETLLRHITIKDKQILTFQAAFAPDFKGLLHSRVHHLIYKIKGGWVGQTGGSTETVLFKAIFAMGQGLRLRKT